MDAHFLILRNAHPEKQKNVCQFLEFEKRASQIDATENLPRMDSVPGVQLDGFAIKKKARVSLTLPSRTPKNVTL